MNPLPTPFCVDIMNVCFLSGIFKVWSVTCLNANEILNFMKIQSSYLLSSYQRDQAYISNYISYYISFEQLFRKFMSVTIILLLFVIRFVFRNVIDGNGK